MSFSQLLSVISARWKIALTVLLTLVTLTVVVSVLLPKQYEATASVVVDLKPDPLSAMMLGGMPSPAIMATQADIISSDRVALRVVRNLKLAENSQIRQTWLDETNGEGDIETWLIALFHKKLTVVPSRESSVIQVTYKAPDPRFAAAVSNAFVQAYLETALELRTDPAKQYSNFFSEQVKGAREQLEAAQIKLSRFQNQNGIIATDERLDVENQRLNELTSQLVALQAVSAESQSRQAAAQGSQGSSLQEVLNNPIVGQLKADINRAEARLKELNTKLGSNHPSVAEAQASLQESRQRLDAEIRRVTSGVGLNNSINRSREEQLRRELDSQRQKVLQMKAVRDEGMLIQREVENSQRAYDAIQQRLTQSSLESQATQSNVNVLTNAVPPIEASSPKLLLNTILSVFVGSLLAAGVAVWKELRDRRVRSAEDVLTALQVPVIAVLGGSDKTGGKDRSALRMKRTLLLGAPKSGA